MNNDNTNNKMIKLGSKTIGMEEYKLKNEYILITNVVVVSTSIGIQNTNY